MGLEVKIGQARMNKIAVINGTSRIAIRVNEPIALSASRFLFLRFL
jgi:hypothetical protein